MRARRLIREEHEARIAQKKCPRCKQHDLSQSMLGRPYGKLKAFTSFWSCSGPRGHECYYLVDSTSEILYESAEGTSAVDLETKDLKSQEPYVPKVIRRPRHTGKKYQQPIAR